MSAFKPGRSAIGSRRTSFTIHESSEYVGSQSERGACTRAAALLYGQVFRRVVEVSSPKVAELAKLYEASRQWDKAIELRALRDAAAKSRILLQELPARSKEEIEAALAGLGRADSQALVVLGESLSFAHRKRIDELARASRVPVVSNLTQHTEAGGLASYTADGALLHVGSGRIEAASRRIAFVEAPGGIRLELMEQLEDPS